MMNEMYILSSICINLFQVHSASLKDTLFISVWDGPNSLVVYAVDTHLGTGRVQ